jgi:hypothetical protein
MGVEVTMYDGFSAHHEDEATDKQVRRIKRKVNLLKNTDKEYKGLYGWNVEVNNGYITIELQKGMRGILMDYVNPLLYFLDYIKKYDYHLCGSVAYMEDYLNGVLYLDNDTKTAKTVSIDRIYGDVSISNIA